MFFMKKSIVFLFYTYTHFFLYYFPLWFITRHWIQFPVIYNRTLLLIHSKCSGLHLPAPNSQSIPLPPHSPLPTTNLFSLSMNLFLFVQFSSVTHSFPTLCDSMNCSMPGLPVHHQLTESTQTTPLSRWCHPTISSSAIPFSSCPQSFPASGFFKWVSSSHQVAKVLEFQLQHQSFQWTPRTDLL